MSKRSYKQNCALAQASDALGERWSLLLVRDLLVGPRRFGELQRSLRGMGSNLLSARLRELKAAGIVEHTDDGDLQHHYKLTKAGKALEPTLLSLLRWGMVHGPDPQNGYHHRDDWDLLALKAMFQPELAGDLSLCVQFKTNEFDGWASIRDKTVEIGLGSVSADVVVAGTVKELFFGPHGAQLCSSGSKRRLAKFMSSFTLPALS